MSNEIERKFLVKNLPDLNDFTPIDYERYFLFRGPSAEIRIQRKGDKFEFERKITKTNLSAQKYKFDLTKEEFEKLKNLSNESILRKSYLLSKNPEITLKLYGGKFQGLKRLEVEFESENEAQNFEPPSWFGNEITNSSLGRDSKLLDLSDEEVRSFNSKSN